MAIQPHSRIESQLTDPTYKGPYLSRIELILKDMLENYGRIAFVGPYDSLEDLPETGQAGYVYLVRVEGSNLCDEYIWDEQEEEYNYVGRFEIDLADYQTKDLSNPITIDSVVYTTVEAALAAMNVSLSNVSRDALNKVSTMPQNPSNNDLVVWQGNNAYKVGHTYKYVEGTGETLYAWQVDNPGGIGDGTVIYTKSAIPNEDTNIYKSDGTAYSSSTDDPTYELMVGGESAITIEIFSLSQMQSWERSALRKSSEDIVATSGEWVEVTKDNIQDDWEQSDSSAPDYIKNKPTLGTAASRNATNQITEGSTALPEAGAVKTALDGKEKSGVAETLVKDTVGWTGKNKLPLTLDVVKAANTTGMWSGKSYSYKGIVYTFVTDESNNIVSVRVVGNNTTGVVSYLTFTIRTTSEAYLDSGNYILSGGNTDLPITFTNQNGNIIATDSGNGATFAITVLEKHSCGVEVANDTSVDTTVYPMIRDASIADPTFEPHHSTVDTVKADKVTNATSGHLAGLDSNGNLTDSGVSPTEEVTVEGNPVTFDSPFEQDAKSVVVSVKPIQDLHGYDHPWPAGGGKNIFNKDDVLYGYFASSGEIVDAVPEAAWRCAYLPIIGGENYTVSGCNENSSTYVCWFDANKDLISNVYGHKNMTYTAPANAVYMGVNAIQMNNLSHDIDTMQVEKGSTATSYAPYSNICPISGIDEVEIEVSGKNLFDKSKVVQGSKTEPSSGTRCCTRGFFGLYLNAGTVITYSSNSYDVYCSFEIIDKDYNTYQDSGWITQNTTITITASGYAFFGFRKANNSNIQPSDIQALNIQFELGTTPTSYEPYNPNSHTTTIPLPSTLYDADVDVTEGDADRTKDKIVLDGSDDEGWLKSTAELPPGRQLFYPKNFPNSKPAGDDGNTNLVSMSSNMYDIGTTSYFELFSMTSFAIGIGGTASGATIGVNVDGSVIDTIADFKAWLAQNPLEICYELSTPTILSFDPTDVELLEGTNVMTTNGEKVAVTYKAGILATLGDIDDLNDKVKTKFDKANVATIEPRSTASKTYYKGDYIVRSDGCLYDVTATIASGAAFTNNNTHKTNLGDELNKFKVYVSTADSPVDGNDVASVSISGYLPISPFQVFSWSGSGTVSITPKSSGGTWSVSGDVSNVRYGQIFMRT